MAAKIFKKMTAREKIVSDLDGLKKRLSEWRWVEVERLSDDAGVVIGVTFYRGTFRKERGRWIKPDELLLYRTGLVWRIAGENADYVIERGKF